MSIRTEVPNKFYISSDTLLTELCEQCGGSQVLCESDDKTSCINQYLNNNPQVVVIEGFTAIDEYEEMDIRYDPFWGVFVSREHHICPMPTCGWMIPDKSEKCLNPLCRAVNPYYIEEVNYQ